MLFSPTCFYPLLPSVRHNWDVSVLGHGWGETESTNMGCAGHARCPAACRGVGEGFASFLWLQETKLPELSPAWTDVSTEHKYSAPCLPPAWGWLPVGHSLFEMLFTRIHSTPEQAPFLVARSNPDVAKHLGLVPHCHLIMAFLRNKSIFNSAPGFLGHIWFSWVQPRWRCCCGFLQGCSWGNRARGTSLIPRNPRDTRGVLLQNDWEDRVWQGMMEG